MSVYDDVKKALQDLLAPELKEIAGEMKAINVRLDGIDQRFDDLIERLDLKNRVEKLERAQDQKAGTN
jgi:hypothetical protein